MEAIHVNLCLLGVTHAIYPRVRHNHSGDSWGIGVPRRHLQRESREAHRSSKGRREANPYMRAGRSGLHSAWADAVAKHRGEK